MPYGRFPRDVFAYSTISDSGPSIFAAVWTARSSKAERSGLTAIPALKKGFFSTGRAMVPGAWWVSGLQDTEGRLR